MTHVSLAVYLIEAGLVLIVGPWTTWWERNYFVSLLPSLGVVMATSATRTVVVAAGVVTVLAGMSDLRAAIGARLARRLSQVSDPPEEIRQ